MNRYSCFYRLIKPKLSSSSSVSVLKRLYHTDGSISIPSVEDTKPFRITDTAPYKSRANTNDKTFCQILGPGIIVLKNYVSAKHKTDIWDSTRTYGMGPRMNAERIQNHRLCFGRNWDPVTGYHEHHCRSDGTEPLLLPYKFISLARDAIVRVKDHLHQLPFPEMCPDTCIIDHYSNSDQFCVLQQDRDESFASLTSGSPVISVFLGDTAEFLYGYTSDENKLRSILLESGDVLMYGGKSRLIFHKVKKIIKETSSSEFLSHMTGCLNLTLRKF